MSSGIYIAQYPVNRTAQRALYVTLGNNIMFNRTPYKPLEKFQPRTINPQIIFIQTEIPRTVHSQLLVYPADRTRVTYTVTELVNCSTRQNWFLIRVFSIERAILHSLHNCVLGECFNMETELFKDLLPCLTSKVTLDTATTPMRPHLFQTRWVNGFGCT